MSTALPTQSRRIVLAARPVGEPKASDFRLETGPVPAVGPGQVLVRVIYLSLDPYMRGRMRDGPSYAPPVPIGGTMVGGTVGEVIASENPAFKVGDIIEDRLGWQEYAVTNGVTLRKVDPALAPISTANGILGMPGMTAWFGLFEIGRPRPGETVVVSAASGAVGQVVGQLAKQAGARVVGIAGGAKKCAYVTSELGFDAAIDYKAEGNLDAAVKGACPHGVDVYFENVGGVVGDAVTANMAVWGRIALCGAISQYNAEKPELAPRLPGLFVGRRVTQQGFIVSDYQAKWEPARRLMAEMIRKGALKYREDITPGGIDKAPAAFIGMLRGDNFGKAQVQVSADPTRRS
jgi:hypothetical protein